MSSPSTLVLPTVEISFDISLGPNRTSFLNLNAPSDFILFQKLSLEGGVISGHSFLYSLKQVADRIRWIRELLGPSVSEYHSFIEEKHTYTQTHTYFFKITQSCVYCIGGNKLKCTL